MIRVSQAQAAHFILQKNHLTTPAPNLTELLTALGGIPAEPSTTPPLAAGLRLAGFKATDLSALHRERSLIRGMLMRGQPHVVLTGTFATYFAATARQHKQQLNSEFRLWDIENEEIEQVGRRIVTLIGDEPLSQAVIEERLPAAMRRDLKQTSRGGRVSTTTNVAQALRWLTATGILYAAEMAGADSPVYGPLAHWYPDLDLTALPTEASAQEAVVRTYLAAFGPASEADVSFWTGFGKSETARAITSLSAETTLTLVEGIPGMTLLLKNQAQALQEIDPPAQAVVKLLPANDPFTIAHRASRTRYFNNQRLQRQVFSSSGAARPAVVCDGKIVGTWDVGDEISIAIEWLAEVDGEVKAKAEAEAEILVKEIGLT